MYTFVFFHGWASDTRVWFKVYPALKALGHSVVLVSMGYVGKRTKIPNLTDSIVVAHSLGVMDVYMHLSRTKQVPKMLLSIGGFTRFSHTKDFCGVKIHLLTAMKKTLEENLEMGLQTFRKNANCTVDFSNVVWSKRALLQGLDTLIHRDVRLLHKEFTEKYFLPVFALWGARDRIVSRALTMACFGSMEVLEKCGHFIPTEQPQQCVDFICKHAL